MIRNEFESKRTTKIVEINTDLVVAGGGLSGVCAAIVAARQGRKVVLIQDRPVLGGNASSEVRLWALGTTSHMGNNNRWSREGGVINEILLENLKRNKEGNAIIFDTVLLEKVLEEENITLLLNTALYELEKESDRKIKSIVAFCSQNSTTYKVHAPFYCDASGDGIMGFLAGASFRMGAEDAEEFDEGFAPNVEDYGELLGHSIYFSTKDVGKPVKYTPPSYAIKNAAELPRIKNYKFGDQGCRLWWVEHGGRLDTIHQSEDIKLELWKVIYGIWDYVKNSGNFPEAENLTLEWVGTVPGKRESRRFNGDFMLSQRDIVEQRDHYDRVLCGGWAMDLHPGDGVYSKHSSCSQWHSKGVYSIPYRCLYSKDLDNLFIAGRIISATHVAYGSSRIMLTCAMTGQVAGMATDICLKNGYTTRQLSEEKNIRELQVALNKKGQSIPRLDWHDEKDLIHKATVEASSELSLSAFNPGNEWQSLNFSTAQLLPLKQGVNYEFKMKVRSKETTNLEVQLKCSSSSKHFTPEVIWQKEIYKLEGGEQEVVFKMDKPLDRDQYAYVAYMQNEDVDILLSEERITGIMTVQNKINRAVSNYGKQEPPQGIGIDAFEFWTPERRPGGKNLAMNIMPAIEAFGVCNVSNEEVRPLSTGDVNGWVAKMEDEQPTITISWNEDQQISRLQLSFDPDYDHSMECNHMEHPESEVPFVVNDYQVFDGDGKEIYLKQGNFQAINEIAFNEVVKTKQIRIVFNKKITTVPVALFKVAVYE
ncbi:FAD-dependent oxidoreductase [Puteibacter caeruleilacunae]|nr:FAD-dependent oxidoreductase [Puteibacter caeruleilacunae]